MLLVSVGLNTSQINKYKINMDKKQSAGRVYRALEEYTESPYHPRIIPPSSLSNQLQSDRDALFATDRSPHFHFLCISRLSHFPLALKLALSK